MMKMWCVALLLIIVITQSNYDVVVGCVLKNKTCECVAADIGTNNEDLLLDCKEGAESLVLNDAKLSEENWPSGLNLKSTDIVNLVLSNNSFQAIPSNHLPTELQVLNLSGNIINQITGTRISRFKELKILDLSYNSISNFDDDVFDGLCKLEELYLKGNSLHNFGNIYNAVRKVQSLTIMDLAENRLNNVFIPVSLKNLKVFNLRNNTISAVSIDRCIHKLPNLTKIDLGCNNLTVFPISIVDYFNETNITLEHNPLQCHCHIRIPLMNNKCNNKTVNFSKNCKNISDPVPTETDSKSVILSSGNEIHQQKVFDSYCSEQKNATLNGLVTEIFWEAPDDIGICIENRDLMKITQNGSLDLTLASQYDISGVYSYKEYHVCNETYFYTATGKVRFKGKTETQQCLDYCELITVEPSRWILISCIVFGGCMCALAVSAVVYRIKKLLNSSGGKDNEEIEISTQEAPPSGTSITDIDPEVAPSQTRVSLVVINGYLTHVNHGSSLNMDIQSTDILQNAAEAIERGFRSISIDENGYLIMKPSLGNDLTDDPNGYYTYIPNKSANKVLLDKDGYLCVSSPAITDDGYTCMILRKEQGTLGQLTIHNNYIQLQPTNNHIYSTLFFGGKDNVYTEISTQEASSPGTSTNNIDAEVVRSQTRVSLVVINGYLTRVNQGSSLNIDIDSTDIIENAAKAIERGYRSLSIDENGYLIMKQSLGNDLTDDANGYYTYIPHTSANEIHVDMDGYLCVNPPVLPITDDGYTCMILRKDQGALGQLTIHNNYIQLQPTKRQTDIYSRLLPTWPLLRFWENFGRAKKL